MPCVTPRVRPQFPRGAKIGGLLLFAAILTVFRAWLTRTNPRPPRVRLLGGFRHLASALAAKRARAADHERVE